MKHESAPQLINVEQKVESSPMVPVNAIQEGMAGFVEKLVNKKSTDEELTTLPVTKEKDNWNDFANTAYWIGYQICEAYFNKAPDKKLAIDNMMQSDIAFQ